MIRRIKKHFEGRVPIIANGGIQNVDDLNRCIAETGVDGVMTSEAILENPALFCNSFDPDTNLFRNQIELTEEYLEYCREYPSWHIKTIRSHVMKFLYRYLCHHADLREKVALSHSIDDFVEACKVSCF